MRKLKTLLVISILIILIGSTLGAYVARDFGNVVIKEVKFLGEHGNVIHGHLYIPKGVTPENPAPGVINIHGYLNAKEHQTAFSIEYARRGYVVLAIDMPGHGYSEPAPGGIGGFFSGGPEAFKYLSSLEIVDKSKIAIEGHSMGGWNASYATQFYGEEIHTVVLVGSSSGTFGLDLFNEESPFNFAVIFGDADEFAGLNWEVGDARTIGSSDKLKKSFNVEDDVISGKIYGSFEDNNARAFYSIGTTHAKEHMSKEAVRHAIDFVQQAMPGNNPIPASNQVWQFNEMGKTFNLVGLGLFIFSLGALLLETKLFGILKLKKQEDETYSSNNKWWPILAAFVAIVPAITLLYFKVDTFANITEVMPKAWRPQSVSYATASWVVINGIIFFVMFLVWHYGFAKKHGGNLISYGVSTNSEEKDFSWKYVLKAFSLSIIVLMSAQIMGMLIGGLFKIDFRFFVIGIKALQWNQIPIMLIYIIPFLAYFLISGITVQSFLKSKYNNSTNKSLPYIISILINSIGLVGLLLIHFWGAWNNGIPTFPQHALEGIAAMELVVLLPFTGIITTYFNEKTSSIYTASFINAILITAYTVIGQAIHYYPGL